MTIKELKGLVDFRYMRESAKLGKTVLKLDSGEFLMYFDLIWSEMLNEIGVLESTTDIVITSVDVYTDYALPTSYGGLRQYEIIFTDEISGLARLKLVEISEVPTLGDNLTSGTPNKIAIFPKNDGLYYVYLYPLSGFAGTLRIRYKLISDVLAGVGAGDGTDMDKTIAIPQQYKGTLIMGCLSMLLPEFDGRYREMLANAIYLNAQPTKGHTEYNLGGYGSDSGYHYGLGGY